VVIPKESAKPRKRVPTPRERRWQALFDDVVELGSRLRTDGPELLRRGAIPLVDGHASSTRLEPVRAGGTSDRVGHQVVSGLEAEAKQREEEAAAEAAGKPLPTPDPVTTHVKEMYSLVVSARRLLREADRARARAIYVPAAERPPGTHQEPACVNCARFEVWAEVYKSGRCRACYAYRDRHDRDAPGDLVLNRPENAKRRRYVVPAG
jgi:hypothetical protein